MKFSNYFIAAALVAVGVGCRSAETPTVTTTAISPKTVQNESPLQTTDAPLLQHGSVVSQGSTPDFDYTIEAIPNQHLSATSREGDQPTAVYSNNIIAVYVQPRNGVTVSSTNSPLVPQPGNHPPAQK